MSLILKVKFNLASGEEKALTFTNLNDRKTDQEIKTALDAMVAAGALGAGADAVTGYDSAQKIATTVTDVKLS